MRCGAGGDPIREVTPWPVILCLASHAGTLHDPMAIRTLVGGDEAEEGHKGRSGLAEHGLAVWLVCIVEWIG